MTRSQNVKNAERASHGRVARNRYKGTDHWDPWDALGHGWITGHQNKSPASRKDALSASCHQAECSPSANSEGRCHAITVRTPANQQNTGLLMVVTIRRTVAE